MNLLFIASIWILCGLSAALDLDVACVDNTECTVADSICSQALGVCKCVPGYRNVGTTSCVNTFDCRRRNSDCENGAVCDLTTGECPADCGGATIDGFSCNVDSAVKTIEADFTNCPDAYLPGSQFCLDDVASSGTYTVLCKNGFYGTNCEIPRIYAVCDDPAAITIVANPYTETSATFDGKVYALDHETDGVCDIVAGGITAAQGLTLSGAITASDFLGLASDPLNVDQTGAMHPCFDAVTGRQTDTPNTGDTTYELKVIVQYNSLYHSSLDEIHTLQCVHKGAASYFTNFGSTLDSNTDQSQGGSNAQPFSPVTFTIEDQSAALGTPLAAPVTVSTPLRLHIKLATNAKYTSFLVESCVAQDEPFLAVPTGNEKSINLMTTGCADGDNTAIFEADPLDLTGGDFTMKFIAFKFVDKAQLYFQCDIKLCDASTAANCAATGCTAGLGGPSGGGTSAGFGRKRRQTSGQETVKANSGIVTVIGAGDDVSKYIGNLSGNQNTVTSESCLQSTGFLVTVGILAALLLVAVVVSLYMCVRLTSLGNSSSNEKIVYKA
ncbi:unnamed protein product [Owenia fusiformis]|uniref:Uncharacterized protein n=1 Tax=Owenia fusiformis TaxID=6347 RepID=A0A8J1UC82_OWEFU|nr:unnamed protein product [Owenia fusiformis]